MPAQLCVALSLGRLCQQRMALAACWKDACTSTHHMLATGLCVPMSVLQPPSARAASCRCPTPPLPCACRGRRSRTVSLSVAQCRSQDPPQRLHMQRLHAWHWLAGWLAGWRAYDGKAEQWWWHPRRAAALLEPTSTLHPLLLQHQQHLSLRLLHVERSPAHH